MCRSWHLMSWTTIPNPKIIFLEADQPHGKQLIFFKVTDFFFNTRVSCRDSPTPYGLWSLWLLDTFHLWAKKNTRAITLNNSCAELRARGIGIPTGGRRGSDPHDT